MFKWIGKMLGGTSFDVPDGVPSEWVSRLEKLVGPVDKLDGNKGRDGLARDMLSYVLCGDPIAVLHEVGQREGVAQHLRLRGYHYDATSESTGVYDGFEAIPAAIALRWAKLLEACVAHTPSYFKMPFSSGTHWPEVLLLHCAGSSMDSWSSERPKPYNVSMAKFEAMLAEDGLEPSALLVAALNLPNPSAWGVEQRLQMVSDLSGYAEALDRDLEVIRASFGNMQVAQRLHVLNMMEKVSPATLDKLGSELADMCVANSKQVRAAAEAVVRKAGAAVYAPLRTIAVKGKPDQRVYALRLLAALARERGDSSLAGFTRDSAAADKAPSVQALLGEWEAAHTPTAAAAQAYQYTVPKVDWSAAVNAPSDKVLDELWRKVNEAITKSNKNALEYNERMLAQGHKYQLDQTPLYSERDQKVLRDYLNSDQRQPPSRTDKRDRPWQHFAPLLSAYAADGKFTPVTLFKLLWFSELPVTSDGSLHYQAASAFDALHRSTGRPTLLELSQIMDDAGLSGEALLFNYCYSWGRAFAADWADEAVWPYFAHHIDRLVQNLTQNMTKNYSFSRDGLFRAIATLPSPPPAVISALFSLALGSGKTDRMAAQKALDNFVGKEARIINALADGKGETRAVAAQWLGKLHYAPAIPALEQAVAKEKQDVAKGAMLDALQLLGQPVEKYLGRAVLDKEATKTLAKGIPKVLEWFPWTAMPAVRWADTHAAVSVDTLRWMLVQAVKQKSPEPNAVLRKYCAMFEARDREQFGQFVLENWLREDICPISAEEALSRARANAQSTHQSMTQYAQYYQNNPLLGKSVEELTAAFLPGYLRQPAGSATGSKGLLAVAAACAAERAAAPTQRYLKEWYGSRAAQGKALIAMLAWIEHPTATQLMLSIGNRFRTKSFQEEATRQAEILAERKGWTLAELADRTIPSAGFDETGVLELSYGARIFSARLLPNFKIELLNPDGKKIASLPESRQDDDAERAKDAKKAFSAAKKEIKGVVDLQTDRLYEALCTGRDWSYADWNLYLFQHPVMRHLVQRLIWVQVVDGKVERTFRPLDDGSLTDSEDSPVQFKDDDRVRIAHDSVLAAEAVTAWQQHLVDYEVTPLFQQLGKGTYTLPADKANSEEIKDFEGHLLEAFALRGRALKLGYTRGAAEDGGWFHVYEKRFPTLGLEAVIEFTGNPLPEENRTVALLNLSFSISGASQTWGRAHLQLDKVPKVLLSECYNDLRLIASEGTGYDADWQKKSEY